jgi:hypothetical protein
VRAAPTGFELHSEIVKASNDRIRGRIEHHQLARKRMKQDAYFRDQSLMLVFLHWSQGAFVDTEEIRSMVADCDGNSLVISARSNDLAPRGDCFRNSKLFESGSSYSQPMLYVQHQLFDDDDSLLASYLDMRTRNGLDTTRELQEEYVQAVREAGGIADQPFATQLLILAYDDGEEVESVAPVLLVKRGGFELAVEYLLSGFNGGNILSRCAEFQGFICDDGQTRQFDLSHVQDERISWLDDSDFDVDAHGHTQQVHRSILNINESALAALRSRLAVPERIARILAAEQVELLREQIRGELLAQSDFVGLELFQQNLPDSRFDASRTASRRIAERLSADAQEWDAWAQEEGIVPPDGDSRW